MIYLFIYLLRFFGRFIIKFILQKDLYYVVSKKFQIYRN